MNNYVVGQLAAAFTTAMTHEDDATRARAELRVADWAQALSAIQEGTVRVGSRTPTTWPAWVTLSVLRGGFAIGDAVAAGPLDDDERDVALAHGLPESRGAVFVHYLADAGLAELDALLDSGHYRVEVPEDAALLVVAWLVRHGDRAGALELVSELRPYADDLRFAPRSTARPIRAPEDVVRTTVGEARAVLQARRERERVETQREALEVWAPFADRVLTLWLELSEDGSLPDEVPAPWRDKAVILLQEYDELRARHPRCTRHRRPKENLAILLRSLATITAGDTPEPRERGLLRTAIRGMLDKRGRPGSDAHAAIRDRDATTVRSPSHARVCAVAAQRLSPLDPMEGLADPSAYAGAVTTTEAATSGVPAGVPMPAAVARTLRRTRSAPIDVLIAEGLVPSSEVLAALVPAVTSMVIGASYDDPALARLMAANYRAFRARRSLLLLNLEKQVQLGELPWVRHATPHGGGDPRRVATDVLRRVGSLACDHFPGTILPNNLVRELDALSRLAGTPAPFVEELAADIFMGHFSDKFRRAAQIAAPYLRDGIYADYYEIDTDQLLALPEPPDSSVPKRRRRRKRRPPTEPDFSGICRARAGVELGGWNVAANGTVIEQGAILTSHNLATLEALGVQPRRSWAELADEAWRRCAALLALARTQPRPLATIKNAAFAWRQSLYFLSHDSVDLATFLTGAEASADGDPWAHAVLDGLRHIGAGRAWAETPHPRIRPFLGWTVGRHWLLDVDPLTSHQLACPG